MPRCGFSLCPHKGRGEDDFCEFDHRTKQSNLMLERRSNFEEQVLLDRYKVVRDLERRIQKVITDLNRLQHGSKVEGLTNGQDIVPLTEVFVDLSINRFLLTERLHNVLYKQAQLVLKLAKEQEPGRTRELEREYLNSQEEFIAGMNREFAIDKITYSMEGR
jgi:hypothetical protein